MKNKKNENVNNHKTDFTKLFEALKNYVMSEDEIKAYQMLEDYDKGLVTTDDLKKIYLEKDYLKDIIGKDSID